MTEPLQTTLDGPDEPLAPVQTGGSHESVRLFDHTPTMRGQMALDTDRAEPPARTLRIVATDCRTGWLVVDAAGRPAPDFPIYRRRDTARAAIAEYRTLA